MEEVKQINIRNYLIKVFWVFLVGSIIGCFVELIVCFVQKGYLEPRQGLIYGPFIPVYGIGAVFYYILITKVKDPTKVFFLSMLIGGSIEYSCSYVQEVFFGTISWDYSNLWFDINGRTSLLHCIYWGIAGLLFIKFVYPNIEKIGQFASKKVFYYITMVLVAFMLWNISISCLAAERQKARLYQIPPRGQFDQYLDKYYPDERMNYVYSNKIVKSKEI